MYSRMYTISHLNQRRDSVLNIPNAKTGTSGSLQTSSFEKQALTFEFQATDHNFRRSFDLGSKAAGVTDSLYPHFRTFLIFGKCIGLIPVEGLLKPNLDQVAFKKQSLASFVSIVIWILLASASLVSLVHIGRANVSNAGDYASVPGGFLFHGIGLFVYIYYLRNSPALIAIFQQWNRMQLHNTKLDSGLTRYVNTLAGIVLTSAILENITGHLRCIPALFPPGHDEQGMSAIELYYRREQTPWAELVPYHPLLSAVLFVVNKIALYAWNFMDITVAIFARAIYYKFKILYLVGKFQLFDCGIKNSMDVQKWRQFTEDFEKLMKMLRQISDLLSPLVFVSFAANIYFVILHVHHGIMPGGSQSTVAAIYFKWAFIHLIARLCMVSLVSAKINTWAHKCGELFSNCPKEAYIVEVQRADHFLSSGTIGFNGLGCFTVAKPLLLQIVSVVFTFEIVLLQASQTSVK